MADYCPDENVLSAIKNLTLEHALVQGDIVLAYRTAKNLDLEAVEQELEHPTQYADEVSYHQLLLRYIF